MTPQQFRAWRDRHGWSREQTGQALGISADSVVLYERGARKDGSRPVEIPKRVRLAMAAIELGIADYDGEEMSRRSDVPV
ncbi:MAG: helix-turn-helix transcriptional regulator [Magnetospirillum sp.]|nr:helix-turn-helix transcriptional regulator [Magnetospirillum sp.]